MLYLSIAGRVRLAELARAMEPGAWLALAAIDPANRFSQALAQLLAESAVGYQDVGELVRAGFTDIELAEATEELRVLPTQQWLLRAAPSLAAKAPAERARIAREIAARLKDLWREDAFRVPVAVRCVHARKRRME